MFLAQFISPALSLLSTHAQILNFFFVNHIKGTSSRRRWLNAHLTTYFNDQNLCCDWYTLHDVGDTLVWKRVWPRARETILYPILNSRSKPSTITLL